MAFGWFRVFRSSRLANDGFATRATLFPNLFKKFGKGLVMPTYRKGRGNGLHRLQNPWPCPRIRAGMGGDRKQASGALLHSSQIEK